MKQATIRRYDMRKKEIKVNEKVHCRLPKIFQLKYLSNRTNIRGAEGFGR